MFCWNTLGFLQGQMCTPLTPNHSSSFKGSQGVVRSLSRLETEVSGTTNRNVITTGVWEEYVEGLCESDSGNTTRYQGKVFTYSDVIFL